MTAVETLLRRERTVVAMGLAILTLLAWFYIWLGAGTGMSAADMTRLALFPHRYAEPMRNMGSPNGAWILAIAMWWVMMVAMMTPSAAPLVLLYGRVLRQARASSPRGGVYASSIFLAAGYLAVWLAFSVAAASLQYVLVPAGLISAANWWSSSSALSAGVLAAAGLYQLSPFKHRCLTHCRGPVEFLTRHWRPGRTGALVMGLRHGAWCVGCCWMLMALLFVGGIMNLAWIALLTLLVLIEKLMPAGPMVGKMAGVVLLVWAAATAIV